VHLWIPYAQNAAANGTGANRTPLLPGVCLVLAKVRAVIVVGLHLLCGRRGRGEQNDTGGNECLLMLVLHDFLLQSAYAMCNRCRRGLRLD
jgi:hypothetical protein